jgi:hypothetical protein
MLETLTAANNQFLSTLVIEAGLQPQMAGMTQDSTFHSTKTTRIRCVMIYSGARADVM